MPSSLGKKNMFLWLPYRSFTLFSHTHTMLPECQNTKKKTSTKSRKVKKKRHSPCWEKILSILSLSTKQFRFNIWQADYLNHNWEIRFCKSYQHYNKYCCNSIWGLFNWHANLRPTHKFLANVSIAGFLPVLAGCAKINAGWVPSVHYRWHILATNLAVSCLLSRCFSTNTESKAEGKF